MKSTKNNRAIIVGIFIFLGLAIFIGAVLTLGGQQKTFEKLITVRGVFDDVSGLQVGNNIWYSGVKIGTVKRIGLLGNAQVEVQMNIEQQVQKFIRKNAKAKIGSEGFIGNKLIMIYGGTPEAPVISSGDVIAVEKALSTDDMMSTLQENNRNLLAITSDFKNISKRITGGQGTFGKLLSDVALANNLQSAIITLKRAAAYTESLTSNLSDYASRLHKKGSIADELVTDTTVFSSLRTTVAQLKEVAGKASDITNNLKKTSTDLNSGNSAIGTLLHDQQAAADLKATLKNLQSGTEKLDQNMEALQHNFLLRGFFRKKAKAEAKEKDSLP